MSTKAVAAASFAFFDVDDTLIRDKSMFSILTAIESAEPRFRLQKLLRQLDELRTKGADRAKVNLTFYAGLKGLSQELVRRISDKYFETQFREKKNFLIGPVVERLRWHASCGETPVFVSGSAVDFLHPLARRLGVRNVLATRLCCDPPGNYTGAIQGAVMIGQGKRQAISDFLARQETTAAACHAYGDHPSDLEFLESVGFPHVVAGNPELERIARERAWPVLVH